MNGQLSEHPLAEITREISVKRLSGALRLEQSPARVVIYFDQGSIVLAASNVRKLRIREYLEQLDILPAEEIQALSPRRSDVETLSELRSSARISLQTLSALLNRQVTDILRLALLWSDGAWIWDDRARPDASVVVFLDTAGMLLESSRKMRLKFIANRFRNPQEKISPALGRPEGLTLLPNEGFLLSRVTQALPLEELVAMSGLRDLDAYRVIYGLALAQLLERESWPSALEGETPIIRAPQRFEAPETPKTKPKTIDQQLAEFFARIQHSTNHYEVLGIADDADVEIIKRSYYGLARSFHPDRFHTSVSADLHNQIESAFARITQAYETLTDSNSRNAYDAKLAAQERSRRFANEAPKAGESERDGADVVEDLKAEDSFREGFAALQQKQTKVAVAHLAAAARLNPNEPRYRAYYGRALAMEPRTQRLAESELQSAIKLDPNNASFRVMLAELYFDLTFYRRAAVELERALALEPKNASALALQRRLAKKG